MCSMRGWNWNKLVEQEIVAATEKGRRRAEKKSLFHSRESLHEMSLGRSEKKAKSSLVVQKSFLFYDCSTSCPLSARAPRNWPLLDLGGQEERTFSINRFFCVLIIEVQNISLCGIAKGCRVLGS